MVRYVRQPRRQRPGLETLNFDEREQLERGRPFFAGFASVEHMQEAWQQHRTAILAEWAKHSLGRRPFSMWLFELVPEYGERLTTRWWTPEHEANREAWLTMGILHLNTVPPCQEYEWQFLERHNLLTPQERKAVGSWPKAE
jgi:hypothetical protein